MLNFTNELKSLFMNIQTESVAVHLAARDVVTRDEVCSLSSVRRVAAMLDLDPDRFEMGCPLPRGWQFILMGADTRRSLLRADGFPGLGVTMPNLGLPRLLLGSRSVKFLADISIGTAITRKSCIKNLDQKSNQSGPFVMATIEHELYTDEVTEPVLVEQQTYFLLPASRAGQTIAETKNSAKVAGHFVKTVVPDETLLFQYSALGFNSHKIHIDRSHARAVEGFPDLVVNGGLLTLLLTEFLRQDAGVSPASIKIRHLAPLFCGTLITLVMNQLDGMWKLLAYDHRFVLAAEMEVIPDEL